LVVSGTTGAEFEDVSKELAKRIAKHVAEGLQQGEGPPRTAPVHQPTTMLKGAGATFPYPVYAKWFTNYRRENPNVEILYDSIGSEAARLIPAALCLIVLTIARVVYPRPQARVVHFDNRVDVLSCDGGGSTGFSRPRLVVG
jgi:hypothetical protein